MPDDKQNATSLRELPWEGEDLTPKEIWQYHQGFLYQNLHPMDYLVVQLLMAADGPGEGKGDWRENPLLPDKPPVWDDILARLRNPLIPGGPADPAKVLKNYTWTKASTNPLIPR